jgi:hypothetical protein
MIERDGFVFFNPVPDELTIERTVARKPLRRRDYVWRTAKAAVILRLVGLIATLTLATLGIVQILKDAPTSWPLNITAIVSGIVLLWGNHRVSKASIAFSRSYTLAGIGTCCIDLSLMRHTMPMVYTTLSEQYNTFVGKQATRKPWFDGFMIFRLLIEQADDTDSHHIRDALWNLRILHELPLESEISKSLPDNRIIELLNRSALDLIKADIAPIAVAFAIQRDEEDQAYLRATRERQEGTK